MQLYLAVLIILVALAFAGTIAAIAYVAIKLKDKNNQLMQLVVEIPGQNWQAISLISYLNPVLPLPTSGGWAASSNFLIELIKLIEARKPEVVVELGSGLSSLVVAYALRRAGRGQLISLDHDGNYGRKTQQQIAAHGLSDVATIRIAPLSKQLAIPGDLPWYDLDAVKDVQSVDLLVIDGPPYGLGEMVRFPALEVFHERLNDNAVVVLDDANRPGERQIIQRWKQAYPDMQFVMLPLEKGMLVATKSL